MTLKTVIKLEQRCLNLQIHGDLQAQRLVLNSGTSCHYLHSDAQIHVVTSY